MNWFDGFNKVIDYIEKNLEGEIDYLELSDILGYSVYHTQRLFMMISGISLAEYIRCRRLAQAAMELSGSEEKVIDVALKYGYSSPNSFQKAFKTMHGISPSEVKNSGTLIKAFPPLSFEITIKGADIMDYRIERLPSFRVIGKELQTTMENGRCHMEIPKFWGEATQSGETKRILELMDSKPFGLLGIADYNPTFEESDFKYYIAVSSIKSVPANLCEFQVPASTWAIFPHVKDAAKSIQSFQQKIVMEWLSHSGYEFSEGPDVEVYFADGTMETWIPVIKIMKEVF